MAEEALPPPIQNLVKRIDEFNTNKHPSHITHYLEKQKDLIKKGFSTVMDIEKRRTLKLKEDAGFNKFMAEEIRQYARWVKMAAEQDVFDSDQSRWKEVVDKYIRPMVAYRDEVRMKEGAKRVAAQTRARRQAAEKFLRAAPYLHAHLQGKLQNSVQK